MQGCNLLAGKRHNLARSTLARLCYFNIIFKKYLAALQLAARPPKPTGEEGQVGPSTATAARVAAGRCKARVEPYATSSGYAAVFARRHHGKTHARRALTAKGRL
jgi:hypothetical protein